MSGESVEGQYAKDKRQRKKPKHGDEPLRVLPFLCNEKRLLTMYDKTTLYLYDFTGAVMDTKTVKLVPTSYAACNIS